MSKTLFLAICVLGGVVQAQTFTNNALATGTTTKSGTAAPAGYQWSEVQNDAGNTTESNTNLGIASFAINATTPVSYFLADDFVVPPGENWTISSIATFAYFTGYTGATSPIGAMRLSIYSGDPSVPGTAVVYGDDFTNALSSSTEALIYRTSNSLYPAATVPGTTRKVWKNVANVTKLLTPGTYWLKYQFSNVTPTSGGFAPPATVVNSRSLPTWNAKQNDAIAGTWTNVVDAGNPATAPDVVLDFPFIITYTSSLGTNEVLQYDNRVQVYPNPVQDIFHINLPTESINGKTKIEILDMSGKLVKTMKVAKEYSASGLSKGSYIVKISDGNNKKITRLIKE